VGTRDASRPDEAPVLGSTATLVNACDWAIAHCNFNAVAEIVRELGARIPERRDELEQIARLVLIDMSTASARWNAMHDWIVRRAVTA
jgi:hypothetical protein